MVDTTRWRPRLEPVPFEGLGWCFYEVGEMRAPLAGEYYLSGAVVQAWLAPNDYPEGLAYHIVRPTHHAVAVRRWAKGRAITARPEPAALVLVHNNDDDSGEG